MMRKLQYMVNTEGTVISGPYLPSYSACKIADAFYFAVRLL